MSSLCGDLVNSLEERPARKWGNRDMRTGGESLHVGHDELLCLFDRQPRPSLSWRPAEPPLLVPQIFSGGLSRAKRVVGTVVSVAPLVVRSNGAFFVSLTVATERERERERERDRERGWGVGGKEFPGRSVPYALSPFSHLFLLCQCLVVIISSFNV